jgi:signal transduction histidine kinase
VINIAIDQTLSINIKDNGVGIANSSVAGSGNGLINMNTRMRELNGSFDVQNNDGVQISICVPLDV